MHSEGEIYFFLVLKQRSLPREVNKAGQSAFFAAVQPAFLPSMNEVFSSKDYISITRFGKCKLLLFATDQPGQPTCHCLVS